MDVWVAPTFTWFPQLLHFVPTHLTYFPQSLWRRNPELYCSAVAGTKCLWGSYSPHPCWSNMDTDILGTKIPVFYSENHCSGFTRIEPSKIQRSTGVPSPSVAVEPFYFPLPHEQSLSKCQPPSGILYTPTVSPTR